MDDSTRPSTDDEPQLLSEYGGIMLRDFNPKATLHFQGRKCVTCGKEIMDHWLRHSDSADTQGVYWCSRTGNTYSEGITDCKYDVPDDFAQTANQHLVEKYESAPEYSADDEWIDG